MVESDECPQLKSNKMDLLGAMAPAPTLSLFLSLFLSHTLSTILRRTCPVAHPLERFQISHLFVPDQSSVINRGGTLLAFNGMPPTWAVRLAESEVDSPKWSVISSDRHVSCLPLSPLCLTVRR